MIDKQQQGWTEEERVDRAIVLQVLRDDRGRWSRAELEIEISGHDALAVSDALARLEGEGVVVLDGESVRASCCAWRLDALGLIGL